MPPGRTGQWLAVSNHNHSSYWDGKKPLTVLQQEAYLKNLDALVLTDHNTMRGCNSHEFKEPPPGLIMVRGAVRIAQRLGVSYKTLLNRIHAYNLD